MKKISAQFLLFLSMLITLSACSKAPEFFTWQEQVKLNDGRVIVVTQKKRCDLPLQTATRFACIDRENWLTLHMPEFSAAPIIWHENLHPQIVNVHNGRLYVIGTAPTSIESRKYGIYAKPVSPYLGFIWDNGSWKRLPFDQIPEAIYDTNLLIEGIPPKDTVLLIVELKESGLVNGNPNYDMHLKRIDPKHIRKTVPQGNPQN